MSTPKLPKRETPVRQGAKDKMTWRYLSLDGNPGYLWRQLGGELRKGWTAFRRTSKLRGKAAVKQHKRERQAARRIGVVLV